MARGFPLRAVSPRGDEIIHAAAITGNREFMSTACGKSAAFSQYNEVDKAAIVTCVRCIAASAATPRFVTLQGGSQWSLLKKTDD